MEKDWSSFQEENKVETHKKMASELAVDMVSDP